MGMIKRSVILVVALIVLLMLFSLLLPRKISIAKSTEIHATRGEVIKMISDFHYWQKWFPALKDSISIIKILSPDEADIIRNNGNFMHVEFKLKTEDSIKLITSSGSANPAELVFLTQPEKNGIVRLDLVVNTELKWYPWARAQGVFLDKFAGPHYKKAIENIKKFCEEEK